MLANGRIKRFVSFGRYNDDAFESLFRDAGIEVDIKKKPPAQINFLD
jgi:hypothetical protein